MDQGPLVTEQIEAGARFLAEFQKQYPLRTAFWLKDDEDGAWTLYVVSRQITDENHAAAYSEVGRVAVKLRDPWFDMFQVKLLEEDDPLAKAAIELEQRYPGRNRFFNQTFPWVSALEVYFYPSPIPVPAS